ncbi:MAG: DUF268 domain-containing protein [Dysgonamonadaceae bacterium]|jgi:SAM-dependent methyltransferase|nr:DUF268 domain-containing protein [Dysgonamonadaceae bacterium]
MKNFLLNLQILLGFYPRKILVRFKNLPLFYHEKKIFKRSMGNNRDFRITRNYLCLTDRNENSGTYTKHYFKQDLYMAQKIFEQRPQKHVDIGSRIDGFVAHLASFMEVEVLDIRPLDNTIKNIRFTQANLMSRDFPLINYCDSISCLHTIEHLGLGRYGDPIDADGHLKGLDNIHRLLRPGGIFYFSVPIGTQRIEFNAHRIFDVNYLMNYFSEKYDLLSFSYLDDADELHENVDVTAGNIHCQYGCGIFILKKK